MSIISLDGQIYLDLKIDDQDLRTQTNFLDSAYIIESVSSLIPTMAMVINDEADTLVNDFKIMDGNKFTMVLGTSQTELAENYPLNFRLFSFKGNRYQAGYKYAISGIFDSPRFTQDAPQKVYKGGSADALSSLASDCGIDFEAGSKTSDYQTWLNAGETMSLFARRIAQHSHKENGLMQLCLLANNTLMYQDVIEAVNRTNVQYKFVTNQSDQSEDSFLMTDWSPSSRAGFFNSWINYGYNLIEPSLDGVQHFNNEISLSTGYSLPSVNQQVTDMVEISRTDYAPIDCGNTHDNYWKAFHNNLRLSGLFNQSLICMVPAVTNLSPLEPVQVEIYNANTARPNNYSGTYIISAKKSLIKGTRYVEIFELLRPGVM